MYELNPEGIVKIYPRLISKQHYILSLNKITGDFFQTDNQPTIGTNVTRDTQHTGSVCNVIHCTYWLYKCSLLPFKENYLASTSLNLPLNMDLSIVICP